MARQAGISIENNFSRGLLTEVTGVNSPENSVSDSIDVVFDRLGRARSRPPLKFEDSAVPRNIITSGVLNEYVWDTNADNDSVSFAVIQIGSRVRFFEISGDGSLSSGYKSFNINLLTYKSSNFTDAQVTSAQCSFTTGKGYLFIAHPYCDTLYVIYDNDSDSITTSRIRIKIRDFEGLDDNLNVDTRPSSLTNAHKYNLFNQGWYTGAYSGGSQANNPNVLETWDARRTDFPANSDVWWYYTSLSTDSRGVEVFDPSLVEPRTGLYGNTPAPKGHYIINAMQTNRSSLSGVNVTETTSGGLRPAVVAFYAGRVFYAGVSKDDYSSTIYFSQIIESNDQFEKCYQRNDPTSKEAFDLLATDGGTVKIQDMSTVIDMRVIGDTIFVFATNGVWAVGGTDNTPFRATDYSVSKVSSFPAISKSSVVDVGGNPIWWNHEGIFTLKKSEIGLTSDVTNLTQTTIQTLYDDIPYQSKLDAKGVFNDREGIVYWLYNHESTPVTSGYSRVLVFDALSTAFYVLSLPTGTIKIRGVLPIRSASQTTENSFVLTDGSDQVITSLGDTIYVPEVVGLTGTGKIFKFVTSSGSNISFGLFDGDTYLDWGTIAYSPFFITGYRVRGELLKAFQADYLTVITEDVENGSCYVQGVWDYTNDNRSGKFTNPQQVYRSRTYRTYQQSRLRMRGTGNSLQFKFFGEAGKPFAIIGWATFETGNASV